MSPYLKGTQVYLRAIEEEDANETYLSWLNNQETTKGLVTGRFPSSMQSLKSYLRSVTQGENSVMFAICLVENDKHIGNIKLDQFDYFARTAELGVLIGEQNHRGKGIGSESCKLVLDFAFANLNLRKVTLSVFSNNPIAIKTYERLGFQVEGRLKQHFFSDGQYHDKIYMSYFKQQ